MRKQTFIFIALLAAVIGTTSCTEAFKKKMEKANSFLGEMMATSVVVGTSSETANGTTQVMTTLKFEECNADLTDAERERRANNVAHAFYKSLTAEDTKGETHLKITCITTDDVTYEYTFDLAHLALVDECRKIADQMLDACIAQDTVKIRSLKDNSYMPDDQMHIIYDVNAFNDSIYAGLSPKKESLGFRLTDGDDDENLKLFSANYEYGTRDIVTYFTINVDLKTRKVVYIWLKTDDR